jgi:hypothetical protein
LWGRAPGRKFGSINQLHVLIAPRAPTPFDLNCRKHPRASTRKVGLLSRSARDGQLRVETNGHAGVFHQHSKLNHTAGECARPIHTIAFDFPLRFVEKGRNNWALAVIYGAPSVNDERAVAFGCAAIELDSTAAFRRMRSRLKLCPPSFTCAPGKRSQRWLTPRCATIRQFTTVE